MNYQEWEQTVPSEIKGDSVWNAKAYRLALFLAELAWHDSTKLLADKRTFSLADQLNRSGAAYVTPATLDGRWMVRVSIGAEQTERAHVQELWTSMQRAV